MVNTSSQPVRVVADLRGGEAFSGPKDLTVGPGLTVAYPLVFRAPWIGDYAGSLELSFPESGSALFLTFCSLSCSLVDKMRCTSVYSISVLTRN